ncbi:hypothetical protein ABPG72_013844 [Tetrahymena utriculariae]
MFSKIAKYGFNLLNIKNQNSLFQSAKRQFSQKSDQVFLNETQFFKKDQMLIVYQSKEGTFFRAFSAVLGGLMTYNIYSYFTQEDESEKDSSLILGIIFGTTFLVMQWKINKTLKHVYLDSNGRTVVLDFFKHAGFGNELIHTETLNMGGYSYFIHQFTQVPIFKYRYAGKKRFGFLKWSQANDTEILTSIFQKKTFLIGDNPYASKISNTYKKKHQ